MLTIVILAGTLFGAMQDGGTPAPAQQVDWRKEESRLLDSWKELTSRSEFVKAGEAYFSPNGKRIIFQAVPIPEAGKEPDQHYSMYVADLTRNAGGETTGLSNIRRISPKGSANTCGWFHPKHPDTVLFGCTIEPPLAPNKPGFQVGTNKYVWSFPENMKIVTLDLNSLNEGEEPKPVVLFERPGYCAEASWDLTGRFVLYANVDPAKQTGEKPDADIFVFDTVNKTHTPIVVAPGYDGGPFFAPGGKRICYRSDRAGNDLLQLYASDLRYETGADGVPVPTGIEREYQLTSNEHVNWGPFWHPSGEFLVYATSEMGHRNYEVFAIRVDESALDAAAGAASNLASGVATGAPGFEKGKMVQAPSVAIPDLPHARVTNASGADVLPVFSPDGKGMMWTAQRGEVAAGETKPSSQIWIARWRGADPFATDSANPQK
ncbi:MAG: PD40 domain-containing protein [Phycisphaeraceae bacterium]|nr:PD40 domain-containing protein [Phycisphaeraceae bacterium]